MVLLMAKHKERCGEIHGEVPYMPTSEGRTPKTRWDVTAARIGPGHDEFHLWTAKDPIES